MMVLSVRSSSRIRLSILVAALAFLATLQGVAQPNCTPNVPTFNIDFTGNPGGVWLSPPLVRAGNCCGTVSPDRCLHFAITLDTQTVAVNFEIATGAVPPGALYYQIDCGPQHQVGDYICVSGSGVHHLTFCKPGNNTNTYRVTAIPRPTFPFDDTLRVGCSQNITVLGLVENTVTFNSIFPGAPGAYNSYLSCANGCSSPVFTPVAGAPAYIEYQICGFPRASSCGFNVTVCDTVRMYVYPELTASISPSPASYCASASGVTLTANVTGGLGPYTYEWKNSGGTTVGTNTTYFATAPDNYTFYVSDALVPSCPVVSIPAPVNVANVVLSTSQTNVACNGASTGMAVVSATGGNLPYTFSWNSVPVQTDDTASNLPAGTYIVTVTDAGGCAENDTVTLTEPAAIVVALDSANDVTCNGNSNGSIYITTSGGTGTLTYFWTPGGYTTQDISGIGPGTYLCTITDGNGCTDTISATLTEPSTITPLPGLPVSSTDALCYQDSTGTASVNTILLGGTPPYTFNWSTGDTTSSISGLPAGSISLQITDANGCTADTTLTIGEPTPLTSSFPNFSAYFCGYGVSCNGASDGSIDFDIIGGTPTYTFDWNGGAYTTEDLFGIPAGLYTVVVTDANGCTHTDSITITEPAPLVVDATSPVNAGGYNISCHGDSSGVINTSVAGGCLPVTYDWTSPPGLPPDSSQYYLPVGFYSVTVTDINGCAAVDTITLTEPDTIVPRITSIDLNGVNVSCFGGTDGTAYLESILGGSPPFSYYWSTGDSTDTLNNIPVGTYVLTVVDTNGCTNHASIDLSQPDVINSQYSNSHYPSINDPIQFEISCNGFADGYIAIDTVIGGVGPYSYSWTSLPDTTDSIGGLTAGSYQYTITDANNCQVIVDVILTEPDPLDVSAIISNYNGYEIDCNGNATGTIDLIVFGGTINLDYSYSWTPNVSDVTASVSNLTADTYCVHIQDDNGCFVDTCFDMTEPVPLVIDTVYSTEYPGGWNVSCNGGDNGNIFSTSSGGTAPYTYYWSNGDTTANTLNVSVFTYYLTVTDLNGCMANDSITIDEPALITTSIDVQVDVSCFGDSSGSITVSSIGGTPGYSYSLDGIAFDPSTTIGNLTAGTYMLYTADTNGCMDSMMFSINTPAGALSSQVDSQTDVDCFGNATGSVTVSAMDGTPPYQYTIDGVTYQASGTFGNLIAGNYTITVRDSLGCLSIENIAINEPPGVLSVAVAGQTDVDCFGNSSGTATASGNLGTPPYQYSIDGVTFSPDSLFTGLAAGSYTITIMDTNGCTSTAPVTISEPAAALSATYVTTEALCNGSMDGTATVNPSGGTPGYTYAWSTVPVQTTQMAIGLSAGTYSCLITDTNGCTYNVTGIVVGQAAVLSGSGSTTIVLCNGGSTGSATAVPSGGTPGYNYSWNSVPVQTTQTATGLAAGNYDCIITDTNGCMVTVSVVVAEPPALTATSSTTDVLCNGGATGTATISPSGGTPGYTYSWNSVPVQTTPTATGLVAGNYSCDITDTNNCTITVNVVVAEPPVLTAATSSTDVLCNGDATGTATVNPVGGVPGYSYSWNTVPVQTTQTASGIGMGTYDVTVTDTNNCSATFTVTVNEPPALTATTATVDVDCNGNTTGLASVNATGGVVPYTYSWNTIPVQTTDTATGLLAGTYVCTITDSNNCTFDATATIIQPPTLTVSVTGSSSVTCNGGNDGIAIANVSGGTTTYSYSWSPVAGTNDTLSGLAAGTYTVTVTDANSCTGTGSITITDPAALTTSASGPAAVCGSSAALTGVLQNNETGLWTSSDAGVSFNNATNASVQASGMQYATATTFTWTVTDGTTGCTASATVQVIADEPVTAEIEPEDTSFCLHAPDYDGHFHVDAMPPNPGIGTWSIVSGSGVINDPQATTIQYITNQPGVSFLVWTVVNGVCSAADTVMLELRNDGECLDLELPTGFTPNGDSYNDDYDIHGIENYPKNTFIVFNRWGNEVYKKDNYVNHDWKGDNNNGKPLPDGTYYVILLINDGSNMTRNTYVDLRR